MSESATPDRSKAPYGDATARYQELAEHALRHHADRDDEIGTALMTIDVRNTIAQAVAEAARSEPAPKLCADCGCELECVKYGCAKKYAAARDAALEEAARLADEHEDHWRGRQRGSSYNIERKDEAGNIAAAIRALKNAAPQVSSEPYSPPIAGEHPDKPAPAESASRCVK